MRKSFLSLAITAMGILLSAVFSYSQPARTFFPKEDLATIGVYYYPEHWPHSQWERDIKNIASMGFEFVHLGEFAWGFFEPEEGNFQFGWMDSVVAFAKKSGLKVLMGTPTAAPPVWLAEKYPEILMVSDDGIIMRHGSRQQVSWSSEKYLDFVVKIVTQLGQHYGNNKNVMGWQIDNEASHYGRYDYGEAARKRFIEWLRVKYKTIDELNRVWGTAFWSIRYQNFEQIRIPNQTELVQFVNPHALLDFKRFSADEVASFIRLQVQTLRKVVRPEQWITTNYMASHTTVDPWRDADIDFPTYTIYPVTGYTDGKGEQGFRIGASWYVSYSNDFIRPMTGTAGVMELQPGQVNWGTYNYQPYPGAVRLWLWNAFAGGMSLIASYRYRQPLYGYEQYHNGMVGTDGVTPSRGGLEYQQFIREVKKLRTLYKPTVQAPKDYEARRTAILWNPDNIWETDYLKETVEWNAWRHLLKYHSCMKSFGAPVDFINEQIDFSHYPIVIAPSYQLIDKSLVERWKRYVEGGGHLILTPRTGQMDRNAHFWEAPLSEPISELIGAKVEFFDLLSSEHKGKARVGDAVFEWNIWADVLEPAKGTEVLATYDDQFYQGKAAAIHRKLGKGTVTYIGVESQDGRLEKTIIRKVCANVRIPLANLPDDLLVEWRDGFWMAMNYSSLTIDAPVPANAKILIGARSLKPAEVVVWQE